MSIVLRTENLTRYFGDRPAVDHLNIEIPAGVVCGFLGRNGAGKTTTIRMLMGLLEPTCGKSQLLGCDSRELSPEIRQRIGYVTEGHKLFGWMKISEIEKFQRAFFPDCWDSKLFNEMIEYFELSKKQKIKKLSNGQRAQVSLALTLAPNPELLIMDDPTLGLDAAIRRQFLEGVIQLITRQGRTVLFSSHILADVERVAERIIVLDNGVCKADCTIDQFRKTIRKFVLKFEDKIPEEIDIEGLIRYRCDGDQMEVSVAGVEEGAIESWSKKNCVKEFSEVAMNMEDQFIEFTSPVRKGKLFDWEKSK